MDTPADAAGTAVPDATSDSPAIAAEVPAPVAEYLAAVPEDRAAALLALRAAILGSVPPPVEERYSSGIITLNHQGGVVGYGATDRHCALYVMDPPLVARLMPELIGFDASDGTIRFQPDRPLPEDLVRRIVVDRVVERGDGGRPSGGPPRAGAPAVPLSGLTPAASPGIAAPVSWHRCRVTRCRGGMS